MMDGRLPEPVCKFGLTDRLYHQIQLAIDKICVDRRSRCPFCPGNDTVDDVAELNIPVALMRQPESAELFTLKLRLSASLSPS